MPRVRILCATLSLFLATAMLPAQESASGTFASGFAPAIGTRVEGEPADTQPESYAIDLPTALQLADAVNPQVQFARERIRAAEAELQRANVLWLPNLAAGTDYDRHDGQIQRVEGAVITVSRSSLFVGGGPVLQVALADAYYEPLAARQFVAATQASERATTNGVLLNVALTYWDMLQAKEGIAISQETLENARKLQQLTESYLKAQKLKEADAERAKAELRIRTQLREAADERVLVVSVRLARLLRLDPFLTLQPVEKQLVPVTLVDLNARPADLAALALTNRPELAESRALVQLAVERLRRATYGPLIPSVLLGYDAGGFGGGTNSFFGDFKGRSDFDALVYWEFKNLGFGDRALRRQRDSEVRQAQINEIAEMDLVVSQVADALARARSERTQMESARLAVESALRSYELNWKLFTDGGIELIRPIEVLQSIQALARAREDYLKSVIEYNRAQFELYWALGYPVQEYPR